MGTVHRICAACGQDTPIEARHCPHCGHDTQAGLPVKSGSNLPAVVGKAAVPMLVTAGTLAARLLWKLMRERAFAAGPLPAAPQPQPLARSEPQPVRPATRLRRSIHIRSSWAVGDASGAWRQGTTEHHIEIEE